MTKDSITLFKEAAKRLQEEEIYLTLDNARRNNDNDVELQNTIGEFNLARIELNSELSKGSDKDQDKINNLNTKVNTIYTQIMENENMIAYNEAKNELEAHVNFINAILTTAVNGGDPMEVEEAPEGGCSGSCSSCAGCH